MATAYRDSFASRLIKNILFYSTFYLVVQSVAALNGTFVPPMVGWFGLALSAVLLTELIFVTVRKSQIAVLSISPSLVLVFLIFIYVIRSAFGDGPIEWSLRNVATFLGIATYCIGLLLSAAFGLRSSVRQELLNH